jgi:hypothetical protein
MQGNFKYRPVDRISTLRGGDKLIALEERWRFIRNIVYKPRIMLYNFLVNAANTLFYICGILMFVFDLIMSILE